MRALGSLEPTSSHRRVILAQKIPLSYLRLTPIKLLSGILLQLFSAFVKGKKWIARLRSQARLRAMTTPFSVILHGTK
jgi:hypothetical protein